MSMVWKPADVKQIINDRADVETVSEGAQSVCFVV